MANPSDYTTQDAVRLALVLTQRNRQRDQHGHHPGQIFAGNVTDINPESWVVLLLQDLGQVAQWAAAEHHGGSPDWRAALVQLGATVLAAMEDTDPSAGPF